jgi:AAA domain
MFNRILLDRLRHNASRKHGRLLVQTGARQTGKTTLAREAFPGLPYVSLEDPVSRPAWSRFSAADWVERYPAAILDEVQKAPSVVESICAAHDASTRICLWRFTTCARTMAGRSICSWNSTQDSWRSRSRRARACRPRMPVISAACRTCSTSRC